MSTSDSTRRRRAYLAWLAVCLSWGTTFLATRIALESFPPFTMAGSRHVFAGALLALIVTYRGIPLPPISAWSTHALLGTLMISVGNGTLVWAQQFVPSGLAAVMVSMIPFWMVGVEALMPDGEPMHLRQFIGLALGFGGITLLAGSNLTIDGAAGRQFLLGVVALQSSCLGWALGSTISKRRPQEENVFAATALQMTFGGAILVLVGMVLNEWPQVEVSTRSSLAVLYLIVFGSFVGYISYVYALKHLPVATVSLYAYVNPIIAVFLGWLLLHEPFSARMALGIAVIFVAMLIVRQRRGTSRS